MSNEAPAPEQRLLPAHARCLRLVADVAVRHGVQLFLVGGTVRDLLLGHRPVDLDLSAVDATSEFAPTVAAELGGEVLARSQFGTAKLAIGDVLVDLAIARRESYAQPGALPKVSPGSIHDDLARRDFSINAMAIALSPDRWGDLLDPHGGDGDIERGLVRVLHPGSFAHDATRILRALRYAGRLKFSLEPETERLITHDLSYLDTIKGDRVRNEVQRIFREERAASILERARDLGVLAAIYPSLKAEAPLLEVLHRVPVEPTVENDLLFLSLLACSMPSGDHAGFIARLNMDSSWARVVRDTGSLRDALGTLGAPQLRPSMVYAHLRPFDPAAIGGCALGAENPLVGERLELYLTRLRHERPLLDGRDLIALGIPEGPMVGRILDELLAARLDGELASRTDEEGFVAGRLQGGA